MGHTIKSCASPQCYRCNEYGHISSQCTKVVLNGRTCHKCGKEGHLKWDCPLNNSSHSRCGRCFKLSNYCRCVDGVLLIEKKDEKKDEEEFSKEKLVWLSKKRKKLKNKVRENTQKWLSSIFGSKRKVYCYNCGGEGHLGSSCTQPDYDTLRAIQLRGLSIDWNS